MRGKARISPDNEKKISDAYRVRGAAHVAWESARSLGKLHALSGTCMLRRPPTVAAADTMPVSIIASPP